MNREYDSLIITFLVKNPEYFTTYEYRSYFFVLCLHLILLFYKI